MPQSDSRGSSGTTSGTGALIVPMLGMILCMNLGLTPLAILPPLVAGIVYASTDRYREAIYCLVLIGSFATVWIARWAIFGLPL